jgi:type IV pilus assembly protein PilB
MAKLPPMQELKGRQLGRILIKMGLLTREKVHECLQAQEKKGGKVKIGQIFLEKGLIKEKDLKISLAGQRGMEFVEIDRLEIPSSVIKHVPAQMAKTYHILPIAFDDEKKELTIAVDSPDNFRASDDLSTLTGFTVVPKVSDANAIQDAITKYYAESDESINDLIGEIESDSNLATFRGRDASIDLDDLKEMADSNPVKKLLNLVLLQAIRDKASDVHFEPFENEFKMRYRIDGILYEMMPPPKHLGPAITSRIKVMAGLDIAERRLPQDGRIELVVGGAPWTCVSRCCRRCTARAW